ncbi:hypothetical protein CCR75_000336 [Bremia lactucae]|uniref:Uncharacterized protein n=1 Tax=Bremia lactucae TaxID=4779 RepID=A0A976FLA6_BRELC|nr:hypothetical protein CCR75_000336 [Bremia lactucae]
MLQTRRLILTSCIHAPLQRNFLQVCSANCLLQQPCTPVIRFCSTDAANSVTAVPPAAHKHNTSKRRKFKKNKQKTVVSAASATPDQAKDNADESIKTADNVAEKTNKVAEDVTMSKPLVPKVKLSQKQRKITTKKEVEEKILAGVVRKDSKVTTVTAIATQSPKKDKQDKSSPAQVATTVATQSFKKDKQDKNSSIQAATETALQIN